MTKVNFTACFDATFEYDKEKKLRINSNVFQKLDENNQPIPVLDANGEQKKDKNDNPMFETYKKTAKEVLDDFIKNADVVGNFGFFESNIETDGNDVYEYEANLFDFDVDYETLEVAASTLISTIYTHYTNIRIYTVGKYVAGNSFGIKLVAVIF